MFPDKNFESPAKNEYIFYTIMVYFVIFSGIFNFFIVKPSEGMKENKKLWIKIIIVKFLISIIFLSPLIRILFDINRK